MTRTVLGRMLNFLWIKSFAAIGDIEKIEQLLGFYFDALSIIQRFLSLNSDFSIYQTLKQLEASAPTNPNFEPVLKRNIYNGYCCQPAYDLITYIFKDEANAVFDYLLTEYKNKNYDLSAEYNEIFARFEKTPLKDMQLTDIPTHDEIILKAVICIERLTALLWQLFSIFNFACSSGQSLPFSLKKN